MPLNGRTICRLARNCKQRLFSCATVGQKCGLPLSFAQQNNILERGVAAPPMLLGKHHKSGEPIKHNMRWVFAVMPVGKPRIVGLKAGHHAEQATRPQQRGQPVELFCRLVKVLCSFRTCDEVERPGQGRCLSNKLSADFMRRL